jgi:hypothetical protein
MSASDCCSDRAHFLHFGGCVLADLRCLCVPRLDCLRSVCILVWQLARDDVEGVCNVCAENFPLIGVFRNQRVLVGLSCSSAARPVCAPAVLQTLIRIVPCVGRIN